jgi:16S rRNA (adenine1518-N6/adenine1519-N6)-dimethyltransferase
VANIPYYITGLLLPLILSGSTQPSKAVFLVQKEVADRIAARDNKQSILSMSVKVYGTPKVIAKVPRGAFVPAPNVDSAIIEIANISKNFFKTISEDQFFATLKKGFAHKRKLLKGNLGLSDQEMTEAGLSPKARAEDITLDDWKKLTELISTK